VGGAGLVDPLDDLEGQADAAGRDQVAVLVVFAGPDEFGAGDFGFGIVRSSFFLPRIARIFTNFGIVSN